MLEFLEIPPVTRPICGTIRPPGSKSITNRAFVLAALASGQTTLTGVLDSQDTRVMIDSLRRLGFQLDQDLAARTCRIAGQAGRIPATTAELWLENSGTSIRFLTAVCALGRGQYRLDGVARMRQRPIGDLARSLNQLGACVQFELPESECPPLLVDGRTTRFQGGSGHVSGEISSQFLSGLLMAATACPSAVHLHVEGQLVSKPYITMTLDMIRAFGGQVEAPPDLSEFVVHPVLLQGRTYDIEPDASAASYFFAAAAITGGTVTVSGLSRDALQGDVQFVSALEQMGCQVEWQADAVTVTGRPLHGIDIDMNAISDTAQTLSVVAVFADGPTTIRNVAHMRHKETDRVAAVVTELQRVGINAQERPDGLVVPPGIPQAASIHTYDDHRMAMSFSLLGLRTPGIRILDPGCTAKTYPDYFDDLRQLCGNSAAGAAT